MSDGANCLPLCELGEICVSELVRKRAAACFLWLCRQQSNDVSVGTQWALQRGRVAKFPGSRPGQRDLGS